MIAISTSNRPSVVPGIYDLAIGNSFTALWLLPRLGFDGNGVARLAYATLSAQKGMTGFMQAVYLDPTPAARWPIPASDTWSTTYK